MKLVKCEVCEEEIIDSLKKCPKCGTPLKKDNGISDRSNVFILIALVLFSLTAVYMTVLNVQSIISYLDEFLDSFDLEALGSITRFIGNTFQRLFACLAAWGIYIYMIKNIKAFKWISLFLILLIPVLVLLDYIIYVFMGGMFDFNNILTALYYIIDFNPILLFCWFAVDKLNQKKEA